MKKIILSGIISWFFALCSQKVAAQESPKSPEQKTETQEIIIRKKGEKDKTIQLEFSGNKVMINGKPLVEFNDDEISVNNRKIVINGKKLERDIDDMMKELDLQMSDLNVQLNDLDVQVNDYNKNFDDYSVYASPASGPFLGVTFDKDKEGAKITSVTKGSPADKAGLQKDDIITKIENTRIDNEENNLYDVISKQKTGDEIKINFLRNGKKKDVKASLSERKPVVVRGYSRAIPGGRTKVITVPDHELNADDRRMAEGFRHYSNGDGPAFAFGFHRKKLGLKIQDLEEGPGVKILAVEDSSAAAIAGLKKEDIITEINGNKVSNTDEAREQLRISNEKSSYPVKAKRNGTEMEFTIKIPKKLKTAEL